MVNYIIIWGNRILEKVKTKVYLQKHIIAICGMVISGVTSIFFSINIQDNTNLSNALSNIGSVLLISGIYTILDTYFLKNDLIDLIIEKVSLDKNVDNTGLIEIGNNLSDINYKDYFTKAKKEIDIMHIYGRTWTANNIDYIKSCIYDRRCKLRIILLDPTSKFVPALESHFGYDAGLLNKYIIESTKIWRDCYKCVDEKKLYFSSRAIRNKKRKNYKTNKYGALEFYYFNGQPTNSLYRIDDKIIVVETKTSNEKSISMPYIIVKKNSNDNNLYNTYFNEIERVISQARKVDFGIEGEIDNVIKC